MQRGTDTHPLVPFTLSSVIAYCEQGREVKAETYDSYVKEGFELPKYWIMPGGLELRFVTGVDIKQAKATLLPSRELTTLQYVNTNIIGMTFRKSQTQSGKTQKAYQRRSSYATSI